MLQITHSPLNEPAAESKRNFNLWSTLHLQKRDAESLNSSLPASNYSDTSTDDNDFDSKPTSPEPLLKSNSLDTNSANSDDHLNEPEDDEDSLKNSSSTDMTYYDYVFQVDNTTDGLNISLQKEESYVNSTTFSIQSSTAASGIANFVFYDALKSHFQRLKTCAL